MLTAIQCPRLAALVAWLCIAAPSTVTAQPEPRLLGRESIVAPAGYRIDDTVRLTRAPDGTGHLLLGQVDPAGIAASRIELIRLDRGGTPDRRQVLASIEHNPEAVYFILAGTQLRTLPSGELSIATPSPELAGGPRGGLLRFSADGRERHRSIFDPPHDVPPSERGWYFRFAFGAMVATTDNSVVLAGTYGPGPNGWWWAKLAANGARLAERTGRDYAALRVEAVSAGPDGGFSLILRDYNKTTRAGEVVLERRAAGGALIHRAVLYAKDSCVSAAFVSDGRIATVTCGAPDRLAYFNANGLPIREMRWGTPAEGHSVRTIPGDSGLLLMTTDDSSPDARIVRLYRNDTVVWRSPPGRYLAATLQGDEVVAIVLEADGRSIAVLRFADP